MITGEQGARKPASPVREETDGKGPSQGHLAGGRLHSARGPGKRAGSNSGTAPRADPTLIPRAQGGVTALHNLALLCSVHHLIAVHRWGWALTLHADGTTTATSPDGKRTYHSHGPPAAVAA